MRFLNKIKSNKILIVIIFSLLLLLPFFLAYSVGQYKAFYEGYELYDLYSKYSFFSKEYLFSKSLIYTPLYKCLIYILKGLSSETALMYITDCLLSLAIYAIMVLKYFDRDKLRLSVYTVLLLLLTWLETFSGIGLAINYKCITLGILLISYSFDLKSKSLSYIILIIGILIGFSICLIIPFVIYFFKKEKRMLCLICGCLIFIVSFLMLLISGVQIDFSVEHVRYIIANTFVPARFFDNDIIHMLGTMLFLVYTILWGLVLVIFLLKKRSCFAISETLTFAIYIAFSLILNSSTLNSRFIVGVSMISIIAILPDLMDAFTLAPKLNLYNTKKFHFSWIRSSIFVFAIASVYLGIAGYEDSLENMSASMVSSVLTEDTMDDYIQDYNVNSFNKYYVYVKKNNLKALPHLDFITTEEGYYKYRGFYDYDGPNDCYWTSGTAILITYSKTPDYLMLKLGCPDAFYGKAYRIYIDNELVAESVFNGEVTSVFEVTVGYTIVRLETEAQMIGSDVRTLGFMIKGVNLLGSASMPEDEMISLYGLTKDDYLGGYWLTGDTAFLIKTSGKDVLTFDIGAVPRFENNTYTILIDDETVYTAAFTDSKYTVWLPVLTKGAHLVRIISTPIPSDTDLRSIAGPLMDYAIRSYDSMKDMSSCIILSGMEETNESAGEYWTNGNAEFLLHKRTNRLYLRYFVPKENVGGNIQILINGKLVYEAKNLEYDQHEVTIDVSEMDELMDIQIKSSSFIQPLNNTEYSVILCDFYFTEVNS